MSEEKKPFVKPAVMVAAVMLLSKLLGFIRQSAIAGLFGASVTTDMYFISSELIINLCAAITTALTSSLITVYIDNVKRNGKESAGQIVSRVLTLLLLFALVLLVLLCVGAYPLSRILEPGLSPEELHEMAKFLRMFSPAFLFSAFQAIYAAVLNANDSFIPGKLYGIIFNPLALLSVFLLRNVLGIDTLIYAYYIANLLFMAMLYVVNRKHYTFRPSLCFRDRQVTLVLKLALPMLISNIAIQFNGVVDKALCAGLGVGIASDYTYAHTLEQFVTGIFTYTITLILFPRITWLAAEEKKDSLTGLLRQAASLMVIALTMVALVTVLCSEDIVKLVYMRGDFGAEDAHMTALALCGFAIGFPIVALRELMIRVHFAFQKTRLPMMIGILEVVLNMALSLVLSRFMGVFGITVATSLSAVLSVALLTITAKRYLPDLKLLCGLRAASKTLTALVGTVAVILLLEDLPGTALRLLLRLMVGCVVYVLILLILRLDRDFPVVQDYMNLVKKKLHR